jgi:cellulose synthase/poly-beta-1,6-N-acetylglucosamine synthase-like glycosyltransferase
VSGGRGPAGASPSSIRQPGEEAPSRFDIWLRQRTRWLKGCFQTYLVHPRRPSRLWRELGPQASISFHAYSGGLLLSALVFPWFAGAVVFGLISGSVNSWPQSPTHQALWAVMSFT